MRSFELTPDEEHRAVAGHASPPGPCPFGEDDVDVAGLIFEVAEHRTERCFGVLAMRDHPAHEHPLRLGGEEVARPDDSSSIEVASDCLLYTSDAADE